MIDDDPMHRTRAMINAGSALEGFARLKGVGKEDRSFSIDEVAKVAGMPKVTCHNYVQRTIFRPSVSGRTGRGGSAELLFSWHDCYVAGLCGAFRRLGLHPDLLREVSILFYSEYRKPDLFDLLPCPICGSEATVSILVTQYSSAYGVSCKGEHVSSCYGLPLNSQETKQKAIDKWNEMCEKMKPKGERHATETGRTVAGQQRTDSKGQVSRLRGQRDLRDG
jgi:transcription elongation factor Elf1